MNLLIHQLRLAVRGLGRAPGFAITATLTLALGIGLSTAVFTVANALLLGRLPVGDQARLVLLWGETGNGAFANYPLTLDEVRDFQRQSRSLADVAFFEFRGAGPLPIRVGESVDAVQVSLVSGNYFDVLRSRPALGRALRPEDDVIGAAPVAVISYRAWQHRFGGDSAIVGRTVTVIHSGHAYTIAGVMPQGLDYPRGTELWIPLIAYGADGGFLDMVSEELDIVGRLAPGATGAHARGELSSFFARPGTPSRNREVRGAVHSFADAVLGDTRPALILVLLAVGLLLLIACVNVANLMLVRAIGRAREFIVRSALGAGRARIASQLLAEGAVLSVSGGLLGVALAMFAVRSLVAVAPPDMLHLDEVELNASALLVGVAISTTVTLLSSLAPALFASRLGALDVLRSGTRSSSSRGATRVAEVLVVAQITLAATTLTAAALVTRSVINLQQVNLSFASDDLLVASLAMTNDLPDAQRQRDALDVVLTRVKALPGVQGVSPVLGVPFVGAGGGIDGKLSAPGQTSDEITGNPMLNMEVAAPNYFELLGTPLLRGRSFRDEDREGSTSVIIVGSSVARHFWRDADPIGRQLGMGGSTFTVVGVVPDTRYRDLWTARPTVYFPLAQSPFPIVPSTLLIRAAGSPNELAPALRRAVVEAHSGVTVVTAASLDTLLDLPRAQLRLNAIILALFAAAAVVLAAVGLFAIVATTVRQRTHELGIRMALGATAGRVRTMVMARGLALAFVGAIIGMAGAVAASRLLASLLFEISPTDVTTLVAVAVSMVGVAAVASFVPARASMRIDPVTALRSDT